jgi:hypothetical protein
MSTHNNAGANKKLHSSVDLPSDTFTVLNRMDVAGGE